MCDRRTHYAVPTELLILAIWNMYRLGHFKYQLVYVCNISVEKHFALCCISMILDRG